MGACGGDVSLLGPYCDGKYEPSFEDYDFGQFPLEVDHKQDIHTEKK